MGDGVDGGAAFGCVNLVGIVASSLVYLHRAGFSALRQQEDIEWREFLVPNLPYFLLTFVKILAWPVVLVAWLAQGLPPSRWRAVTELDGRSVRHVVRMRTCSGCGSCAAAASSRTRPCGG